jgi:hypothetical protein
LYTRILNITLLATLTGCAQTGLYQWGGYEQKLYASYKDPTQIEKLRVSLEEHIADMESSGKKVAPGLYAELGTIYLQTGSSEKAIAMYSKERTAWPESRGLMTAMIQNIERRILAKQESAK